jgi:choline dehydrogenase-like flavoprotein
VRGFRLEEEIVLRAEREVIVAGGAYNSPQLLMLSGVGPAWQLEALGIPVVADLPEVGQNLQDHLLVPLIYAHDEPISLLVAGEPRYQQQFADSRSGPLTSNGPEAGGFARTDAGLAAPNVEFLAAPVMFADNGLGTPTAHALSYGPSMLAARSRGSVQLASDDPTAKPKIIHNYLSEPEDLAEAVEGVRLGLAIARQTALGAYTANPYRPPASDSDDDLRDYIRDFAHSIYHPAATCAMGPVVDPELRVHGVAGLRVVDASVMPTLVRGNPNAPTIAIAEKAADLVRGLPPLAG